MDKLVTIYTSVDSKEKAFEIARKLLCDKLCACVNIFPLQSLYWWEGKIEVADECGIFIKTRKSIYKKTVEKLKEIHPYSVPMIIVYEAEFVFDKYMDWLIKETSNE